MFPLLLPFKASTLLKQIYHPIILRSMPVLLNPHIMKRFLLPAFILLTAVSLNAQQFNVWAFPAGAGGAGVNFNVNPPQMIATGITGSEAAASVCDESGNLLFYTEGTFVWDRNHNLMPNGSDLTPDFGFPGMSRTSSTAQGTVIIPMPDSPSKYYVFSLTSIEWGMNWGRLYYSIVNMELNGGLGDVEATRKALFVDGGLGERMVGVRGDHCNLWLVAPDQGQVGYKAYEVTASGLNTTPVVSNTGTAHYSLTGAIVVSPNRRRLATIGTLGINGMQLADFDPYTGIVSNAVQLIPLGTGGYSCCFSPDNTKLYYVAESYEIRQFDLNAGSTSAIIASETYLGPSSSTQLQLGPDNKIYFNAPGGNALNAISYPNNVGTSAQYTANAIPVLPGTNLMLSLPAALPVFKKDTFSSHTIVNAGCFADVNPVMLQANNTAGWDYVWNNNGAQGPVTSVTSPGTYYVSYRASPCNFHTDTFEVQFPSGVLPDIMMLSSCENDNNGMAYATTFTGDTVNYYYTWQNSQLDTLSQTDTLRDVPSGMYTLRVRTAKCDTTLSFFLPEEEHHVSFLTDTIICMGTVASFQNTSDNHFTQFHWSFGDQDTSQLHSPAHPYPHPGSYRVSLIGKGPVCIDTAFRTITVDTLLDGLFRTRPDSICTGNSITFLPVTDSSTVNLHWQFGDGNEMTGPNEAEVRHAYDSAGILPVTLTTHFRACPDVNYTDTVYVYGLPKVDLGPDTGLCLGGKPIYLSNLEPSPVVPFRSEWNTGDTGRILKVVHPGTYSLTLINAPLGCSSTESITVTKDCYIDIPNAFTPNGDGVNDYFFPRQLLSRNVTAFHMQIFNRWGQVVFETRSKDGRGWDGRFNGTMQPTGVFIYMIEVTLDNRITEHYTGNVSLL
jgi:gliding motility-associated-like protein